MRLIHSFLAALVTLTTLTACGTKTPLTMPPPELPAVKAAVPPTPTPAADNSNKVVPQPRQ